MPKLRPETEKARASSLIKTYQRNGLNQHAVARELGVTQPTINERLKRPAVKKTLQDMIDKNLKKAGISATKVYRKLNEELDATRTISAVVSPDGKDKDANGQTCDFIEVPDHVARDRAIDKCLTLMGHIKQANNNGKGLSIINVVFGHRANPDNSTLRVEERST